MYGRLAVCRASRCLTMAVSSSLTMPGCEKAPRIRRGFDRYSDVVTVTGDARLFTVFGDCRLRRGQVDDRFAGGVGRDQARDREVVHRPRVTA